MTDLDQRAITELRRRDPERWRDIPDARIKTTMAFARTRLNLAGRDVGLSLVEVSRRHREALTNLRRLRAAQNAPRTGPR